MIRFIPNAIRHKFVRAYLAKPVQVRSRTSKNVKKMAIRISTPAATERHSVIRICPQNTEVFSSEHRTYHIPTENGLPLTLARSTVCSTLEISGKHASDDYSVRERNEQTHLQYDITLWQHKLKL